ncbi:CST complex subunit TEN1-like [Littorina saxatilis]|uniref:CST complex subunit TEN1 n=1 Tax=Littorina saxatilis TaxID=31220 RepID=A0AAN9BHA3_9CAEN
MEVRNIPSFGEPFLLQELVEPSQWMQSSISVLGRLDQHDTGHCRARLVEPKSQASLTVDTTLVEPFDARIGSLFHFIGEMKPGDMDKESAMVLAARIVRSCDGLDLTMYEKALKAQRDYLKSREDS